mgnify:CR=1 FL=1
MVALVSCEPTTTTTIYPQPTIYTLQINYIGNRGMGNIPPSDTIRVSCYDEPRLFINKGVPTVIGDQTYEPIATYVRSFKILNKK